MYLCNVCGDTFSETAGTPYHHLKTPKENVNRTFKELSEGMGIRSAARAAGVDKDTVLSWLKKGGQHCQRVSEVMMQELELAQVQLDELWTFVHKKQRRLSEREKALTEWGDAWIWTALDPIHKLIPAVVIGDHTEEEAKGVLRQLRERLADGVLPLFTSDALPHYVEAILQVFGKWVQPERQGDRGRFPKPRPEPQEGLLYATVNKEREKGRVVSVITEVIYGTKEDILARLEALGQGINTSYVERGNLTLRHLTSRLHRKTLCFSKKREYLEYHLHLVLAYYHFVLYHSSLRERLPEPIPTRGDGSPKIWRKQTPAMSAGLTDHKWSMEELLMFQVPAGP
jgi:IS1 family transposase